MKQIIFLIFLLLYLPVLNAQESALEAIRILESQERKAILSSDTIMLASLISADVVIRNTENNLVGRKQLFERLRTGKINYFSYEKQIDTIQIIDKVAIVSGKEIVTPRGAAKNPNRIITRVYTDIWQVQNNRWQLVARQATNVDIK